MARGNVLIYIYQHELKVYFGEFFFEKMVHVCSFFFETLLKFELKLEILTISIEKISLLYYK